MLRIRNSVRFIILASSVFLLIGVAALLVRRRLAEPVPLPPSPPPVQTIKPAKADLSVDLQLSSTLEAASSISVLPRVSGLLLEILVEEGDEVEEGRIMARVDPEPYDLELQAAESAWLSAESAFLRVEQLYASAGASQQQLDEVRTSKDAALSSYELARMRRSYADLRSPMSGRVLLRHVDPGTFVSPQIPLFTVGDIRALQVKAVVPEKYWDRFKDFDAVKVRVRRPGGESRSAAVLRVSPWISPGTKSFEVTCTLDGDSNGWPPGLQVQTIFTLEQREDVWTLPVDTLDGDEVWWVDAEKGTAHALDVGGNFSDGNLLELPGNWSDKLFIIEGQHGLKDGQTVRLKGV